MDANYVGYLQNLETLDFNSPCHYRKNLCNRGRIHT